MNYDNMSAHELLGLAMNDEFMFDIEPVIRSAVIREAIAEMCEWKEDGYDAWETGCGNCFTFTAGAPKENDFLFCCYCGKPIKEVPYVEYVDAEETP